MNWSPFCPVPNHSVRCRNAGCVKHVVVGWSASGSKHSRETLSVKRRICLRTETDKIEKELHSDSLSFLCQQVSSISRGSIHRTIATVSQGSCNSECHVLAHIHQVLIWTVSGARSPNTWVFFFKSFSLRKTRWQGSRLTGDRQGKHQSTDGSQRSIVLLHLLHLRKS